ncbi:hypothetical protein C0J52_00622 [Blattella germanica]|nr:hypothetical protein C0J52_00622 [Blattella germanica]
MAAGDKDALRQISPKFTEETVLNILKRATGNDNVKLVKYEMAESNTRGGDSYLSSLFRLKIEGTANGKTHVVPVIIKALPKNIGRRKTFRSTEFFENEVLTKLMAFQEQRKPKNPFKEIPRCFYALADGNNDFVAMEDMSVHRYASAERMEGLDFEHSAHILQTLARFHALSLAMKDQDPDGFKVLGNSVKETYWHENYKSWYLGQLKKFCNIAMDAISKEYPNSIYEEKLRKFTDDTLYDRLTEMAVGKEPNAVIGHGDTWAPNFLFRYSGDNKANIESIQMIDFQLARYASPVCDFSFFLFSCTTQELRNKCYDQLLKAYHSSLSELLRDLGSSPDDVFSFESFKQELKMYMKFGLGFSLESVPFSVMDESEAANLDLIEGDDAIPIEKIWHVAPLKNKKDRLRIADNVKFAVDNGWTCIMMNKKVDDRSNVKVFCRLRPPQSDEANCVSVVSGTTLSFSSSEASQSGKEMQCTFHRVFDEQATQEAVFDQVALPLVSDLFDGKNGLLIMCGNAGSGKTYTMTGNAEKNGILPHVLDVMFTSIAQFQSAKFLFKPDKMNGFDVQSEGAALKDRQHELDKFLMTARTPEPKMRKGVLGLGAMNHGNISLHCPPIEGVDEDRMYAVFISFIVLYGNGVYDLFDFQDNSRLRHPQAKIVREGSCRNMYVHGVVEEEVKASSEAFQIYLGGLQKKKVVASLLNTSSQRFHSVFTIRLVQAPVDGHINNSLTTLRSCLEIKRENQFLRHKKLMPFRDSKLTYLFKNYFEEEHRIHLVVCLNPVFGDLDEIIVNDDKICRRERNVAWNKPESQETKFAGEQQLMAAARGLGRVTGAGMRFVLSFAGSERRCEKKESQPRGMQEGSGICRRRCSEALSLEEQTKNSESKVAELESKLMDSTSEFDALQQELETVKQKRREVALETVQLGGKLASKFTAQVNKMEQQTFEKLEAQKAKFMQAQTAWRAPTDASQEMWLEHRSGLVNAELGTVMKPHLQRSKKITRLPDAENADVVPTTSGGAQFIFNDVEKLKQCSPLASPARGLTPAESAAAMSADGKNTNAVA